jgi:hypothetical protein
MNSDNNNKVIELKYEIELASLRSHETHMKYIYGLRWGGLALAALAITIGAFMIFLGLQGSLTWAIEAPNSLSAKLTNASPGIVFATVGMILGFIVVLQKPVDYRIRNGQGSDLYRGNSQYQSMSGNVSIHK